VAAEGTTISPGGGLAGRYAAALYGLADERREIDTTVDQIESLGRLIDESPDLQRLLDSPLVDVARARTAVRAVLEEQGFSQMVLDFVGVVANNRRLPALRSIVAAFATLVAEKRGVVVATVASAHKLSVVQREADRGGVRQRQHSGVGRSGAARRHRRARWRPPL
jgi:F-type H+-transporting ATPase subunit delta